MSFDINALADRLIEARRTRTPLETLTAPGESQSLFPPRGYSLKICDKLPSTGAASPGVPANIDLLQVFIEDRVFDEDRGLMGVVKGVE